MDTRNTLTAILLGSLLAGSLPTMGWAYLAFGRPGRPGEAGPLVAAEALRPEPALPGGSGPMPGADGSEDLFAAPTAVEATRMATATEALPVAVSFEANLAEYRTRYHDDAAHRGRAHNVELAAEKLDGAIIAPHGRLSFNTHVGERSRTEGFRMAKVIDGGRLVPGMGGGVCQVASTLHAAALEAGLEMTQYRPHSRPSSYIPMGLDATVSFPQLDLELENPFDFPVLVEAHAEDGEVRVALIGQRREREVEIDRQVLNRQAYGQQVVEDPTLAAGTRVVDQRGIRGARVAVTRHITEDGTTRVEREVVRYPATDEVVRVGTAPVAARSPLWASAGSSAGPLAMR